MPKKKKKRIVSKQSLQSQALNVLRKNPKKSFNYNNFQNKLELEMNHLNY